MAEVVLSVSRFLGYVVFELVLERWAELCVRPFKAPAKSAYAWMAMRGAPRWLQHLLIFPPFMVAVVIVASSPLWIAFLLFMLLRHDTPAEALKSP